MSNIAFPRPVIDEHALRQVIPNLAPGSHRVLGLDLGNNCGTAVMDIIHGRPIDRSVMLAGQLDLSVGPYDTGPLRHIRLKHFLEVLQPTLIGFEDVKFTPDQALAGKPVGVIVARVATAAELLGGFKITLATWAEEHGIPVHGWGIGQIKKWATGRGNANKDDMIEAACKMFGVRLEMDGADNIADAMAICCMTAERYALGL